MHCAKRGDADALKDWEKSHDDTVDSSEIRRETTVWMYKTFVNNGISTTNLNWLYRRISEPPPTV